ncbi:DUF1254 domain-containing protein [Tepidicaulis sp.]|uniref:DUF1254 domain-containing protein n=1 Tax=Tepidicaulis sp. TaxID=1920809 RepID=UPI003B5A66E4
MKPWMKWTLTVLIGAVLVHVAVTWALPRVIMDVAMTRIGGEVGTNQFSHAARASHEFKAVVRPSPDLNYSICVLDVGGGPVRIEAPVSTPYTSISVFAANTDNVFAKNDKDAAADGTVSVIVARKGTEIADARADVVYLPGDKGLALVRRVITSDAQNAKLNAMRENSICAPLGS